MTTKKKPRTSQDNYTFGKNFSMTEKLKKIAFSPEQVLNHRKKAKNLPV